MLTIKMTDCDQCGSILALISGIDCTITKIGNDIYNDLIFALNKSCRTGDMNDLLHYRRILIHKWCNSLYAEDFTVLQIASKVQLMTSGCIPQECCDECIPICTPFVGIAEEPTICTPFVGIAYKYLTTTTTTTITPTTTTTTTAVPEPDCNISQSNGGTGLEDIVYDLSPSGGVVTLHFNSAYYADKLEIIHNSVKKATTGMTVPNEGPFDGAYGIPGSIGIAPNTSADTVAIDQFIGSGKGSWSVRISEYESETGLNIPTYSQGQMIWWIYTPADYLISPVVTARIIGPLDITSWNVTKLCPNPLL